jgi:hypothetical protein
VQFEMLLGESCWAASKPQFQELQPISSGNMVILQIGQICVNPKYPKKQRGGYLMFWVYFE